MEITIKPRFAVAIIVAFALLIGVVIGQTTSAGAVPAASASSTYPILRELQEIKATLGPDVGGSIEPILRQIETFTYNACRAVEGHAGFGHCG